MTGDRPGILGEGITDRGHSVAAANVQLLTI